MSHYTMLYEYTVRVSASPEIQGTTRYFRASDISGESLIQAQTKPWALTLTKPVPTEFEFRPPDWPEKIFF